MTLSPKLGVVGISTLWHFKLPLPIQMFIKVASSPRLSGIGMPSPILWPHPLKMQRIVLLSSLLWWELGTKSLITGLVSDCRFGVSPVNYPDPDPECSDIKAGNLIIHVWKVYMELCVEAHDEQFLMLNSFLIIQYIRKKSLGNNHTKFCVSSLYFHFFKRL